MTGFGRGEHESDSYSFKTEIKAINHRYSDISIRMPRYLNFMEEDIKKEVKKYVKRGKIDVYINLEYLDETSLKIDLDLVLAKELYEKLNELKSYLGIREDLKIKDILNMGDIVKIERRILDEDLLWDGVKIAITKALKDLMEMKRTEGENLKEDMVLKLDIIKSRVDEIEKRSPFLVTEYREKLEARINELLKDESLVNDEKLAEEVAFFADKSNIDEEIIRLKSHIDQYFKIMETTEPIGRKLDFLIQEMNREINTIGSKSGDIEITENVVEVKSEIEKLREQIQNIE